MIKAARVVCLAVLFLLLPLFANAQTKTDSGLLFYLSGDHGLTADFAANSKAQPNYAQDVKAIATGGAKGGYIECGDKDAYSYWAPGNIYAQRGTLSFYWRARTPLGKTEFPIFRVSYGDHSSWDMVWLRIDYNGHGFDAFVTDVNLGRTRVSYALPKIPAANEWLHLAFSWDENRGVRFYVNGKLVDAAAATGMFDAALDQFGPTSRIVSPVSVHSDYNFDRGSDIDELRIYDRMLTDAEIVALQSVPEENPHSSQNQRRMGHPPDLETPRTLADEAVRDEWWFRYGWNRANDVPPALESKAITVRKIEIHDAYDVKRWWWKANDGIRETTWPGVYNRSRLPNRNDYFKLPDWDCYSISGKSITFTMPEEPWNHVEISGGAWGKVELVDGGDSKPLFDRPKAQERTFNRIAQPITGQKIKFTNVEQEWPIGEFGAYYVHDGKEPDGIAKLTYKLTATAEPDNPSVKPLLDFINGRFAADERQTILALPAGAPRAPRKVAQSGLPIVHVLIPADFRDIEVTTGHERHSFSYTWENMNAGLDGIAIDLPALKVKPTHGEYFPLNIQVKDPLWPMRDMLDFSFSVKPNEPHTLWLDLRDRVLPNLKSLYITIAGAGADFGPQSLDGAEIRLAFKPHKEAAKEHELDRFTQVRDLYANILEERPNTRRLNDFARLEADLTDLLRVNPDHVLGQYYWYDFNKEQAHPPFKQPEPPAGVPLWAFRQVEDLRYLKNLVNWYIDNRQIENGEFGGGLSDDGDLTNWWPGTALMGADPEKIKKSLNRELDEFYNQGMFTNGLSTIVTDELHSYEEGISALGQALTLDFGNPKQIERAMATSKRLEWLTGVNRAGHTHIKSSYFNGAQMSEESVWERSKPYSYLVFHPALSLVQYNGTPEMRTLVLKLADSLLAHRKQNGDGKYTLHAIINFRTDEDIDSGRMDRFWPILWAAYCWTGDKKYLQPFYDEGPGSLRWLTADALDMLNTRETWGKALTATVTPDSEDDTGLHFAWQMTGDKKYLEELYGNQIEAAAVREYINTEGSPWIDRVYFNHMELQRARLGGVALYRNFFYPGHVVSWKFHAPATEQSLAVLVPEATPERVKIIAYNLDEKPVTASMTGWDIAPGQWEITQALAVDNNEANVRDAVARTIEFERSKATEITFAPRTTTVLTLRLVKKGVPYWSRPDLGITGEDLRVDGGKMTVKVHSIGAVDAPTAKLVLRDRNGKVVSTAKIPALKAPTDLAPKTADVTLSLPATDYKGGSLTIEMPGSVPEITLLNNRVQF